MSLPEEEVTLEEVESLVEDIVPDIEPKEEVESLAEEVIPTVEPKEEVAITNITTVEQKEPDSQGIGKFGSFLIVFFGLLTGYKLMKK